METISEKSFIEWEPVPVDRQTARQLMKQLLRGLINRSEFPELWPPQKKITIRIGEQELI